MSTDTKPVSSVVTPSGVAIEFFTEPRRHYMIAQTYPLDRQADLEEGVVLESSYYRDPWQEAISVTTALDVLNKPALPWWGMRVGAAALDRLLDMQVLMVVSNGVRMGYALREPCEVKIDGDPVVLPANVLLEIDVLKGIDQFTPIFSKYKLSTNHVKQEAADRGTGVHDAFECWAAIGQLPKPEEHNFQEKPYVEGLLAFLQDAAAGGLTPEMFEVAVASPLYGFAGRFDLLASNELEMKLVTKIYAKWPPKYTVVPAGQRILIDLKTSKDIYETHMIQLPAYRQGLLECGYGEIDSMAVLHVTKDGRYEFRQCKGTIEQYVAVLRADVAMKQARAEMKL